MENREIFNGSYSINEGGQVFTAKGKEVVSKDGKLRLTVDGKRSYYVVNALLEETFPAEIITEVKETVKKETVQATATPEKKEAAPKVEETPKKKMGVIVTIFNCINKIGNVTEKEILEVLKVKFPNRISSSMKNTIRAQIISKKRPVRMEREKKVTFIIEVKEDVKYYSVEK